MKRVWHIAKKDWRRVWPVAAGWLMLELALMVAYLAIGTEMQPEGEFGKVMQWLSPAEVTVRVLVAIYLVVAVVRGDPVAGENLFWVTRPISPGTLLAAKLLAIAALVVALPAAVHVSWWLWLGLGPSQMVSEVPPVLLVHGVVVAVVFPLCMTLNARDKGGTPLLAFLLLVMAVSIVFSSVGGNAARPAPALAQTRHVLFFLLIGMTGAAMVWNQFWRRRATVTTLLFGCGLLAAYLAFHTWPVALIPEPPKSWARVGTAEDFGLSVECRGVRWPSDKAVSAGESRAERMRAIDRTRLIVTVVVNRSEAAKAISADVARGIVAFGDERFTLTGVSRHLGLRTVRSDLLRAVASAIGVPAGSGGFVSEWEFALIPEHTGTQTERWEKRIDARDWAGATLQLDLSGSIEDLRHAYTLPLKDGATAAASSFASRVLRMQTDSKGLVTAHVVETDGRSTKSPWGNYLVGPPVEAIDRNTLAGLGFPSMRYPSDGNRNAMLGVRVRPCAIAIPGGMAAENGGKADPTKEFMLYRITRDNHRFWSANLTYNP